MASDVVSMADLASATAVLRRLTPADIEQPRCAALRAAATALFTRAINKDAFNGKDVREFLAEQTQHKKKLKELKRLEQLIRGEHRRERIDANECGLNTARKATLEQIKQECAALALEGQDELTRIMDAGDAASHCPNVGVELSVVGSVVGVQLRFSAGDATMMTAGAATATNDAAAAAAREGASLTDLCGRRIVEALPGSAPPPPGDFRRICNVCRGDCSHQPRHHFYHQLCLHCGDHNLTKRRQSAELGGTVSVVTGGRVRIGYATVLKLLRAGAFVLTTTRFPADAALRYSREPGFREWHSRCGSF